MGRFGRFLAVVAVACAGVGAYNVYAAYPQLEGDARKQVCPARPACRARLVRQRNSPFGRTFVFTAEGAEVEVACTRAWVLLGDYRCVRQPHVELQAPGAHR